MIFTAFIDLLKQIFNIAVLLFSFFAGTFLSYFLGFDIEEAGKEGEFSFNYVVSMFFTFVTALILNKIILLIIKKINLMQFAAFGNKRVSAGVAIG